MMLAMITKMYYVVGGSKQLNMVHLFDVDRCILEDINRKKLWITSDRKKNNGSK